MNNCKILLVSQYTGNRMRRRKYSSYVRHMQTRELLHCIAEAGEHNFILKRNVVE
jgi:hypothetical protein